MVFNSVGPGGEGDDRFELISPFEPRGDQPAAIEKLVRGFDEGIANQVLLGITGSGKTFTIAKVIEQLGRPALVLAHNKTLAAQLYSEFRSLFPNNAVEYFVSYYDYYQPEAYVPSTNTYIEKDASINERIDRLRHSATRSLLTRRDTIIVASVSCIYGIGSAEDYGAMLIRLGVGDHLGREELVRRLVDVQYSRNDVDFARGTFRVRGDVVEIFPVYEDERAVRVELFGDEIERLSEIDPLRGEVVRRVERAVLFPGSHYVAPTEKLRAAIERIREELRERLAELAASCKLVEKQRLEERTMYDLERLEQLGHCPGIENYSRHIAGRAAGEPASTLLDYFPEDFVTFIDESHQTVPQIGAMSRGDRARKETLVEFGFRLPSAIDNRPLSFEEFEARVGQVCFVSATPAEHELQKAAGEIAEQVIRPTGLMDPVVEVRRAVGQVDDLLGEVRARAERGQRVLVTTLTKRMAEELTEYYDELDVRVRYLHSDIETMERTELLRALRAGDYDVLVGINLLREGLDLPEVSLVAILDADKEGFLRSARSLIQTIGRAARNVDGAVIMYAERMTPSMQEAIRITRERRARQEAYNAEHGITPTTIQKAIDEIGPGAASADYAPLSRRSERGEIAGDPKASAEALREEMLEAAAALDFERAAALRDRLLGLCEEHGIKLRGSKGRSGGGGRGGRRR
ncbi:MAG: excinuclease ABC subunit UvrB [Proteobacteria bacterium]|jgi:excinuclease ABC subunit B|nr:excinuclease ABC subunit UvrB [Pseudomonadota bacterium]